MRFLHDWWRVEEERKAGGPVVLLSVPFDSPFAKVPSPYVLACQGGDDVAAKGTRRDSSHKVLVLPECLFTQCGLTVPRQIPAEQRDDQPDAEGR